MDRKQQNFSTVEKCRLIPTSGDTECANGATNPSENSYDIRRSFQPLTNPDNTASPELAKFLAILLPNLHKEQIRQNVPSE
jgi:hypothetical protein